MNAVGIDVSKGKSMIAVMRPGKEVVIEPFEVSHTDSELIDLAKVIQSLGGETRVVMEATGNYHLPVAWMLHDAGIYVSVVNAMLIHNYGNNTIRKGKTDKKDAQKIANYAIDHWTELLQYFPEEDVRMMLKNCYRQYEHFSKIRTMMKNNLISLWDVTFPDANNLFCSPRRTDGNEKWLDFVETFWHCQCVCELTTAAFSKKYKKWCKKHGYNFSEDKALDIYASACGHVCVMPKTDATEFMMKQAVTQLKTVSKTLAALQLQMQSLAEKLPEYPIVMQMFGVGPTLGPQLMAEIGDGGGRDLAAPQGLGDVLHTPDGYTGQVHLNESLFHAALPAAIPLNNGSFKGDSLELRYLESDIPGSGGEVAVVVAATVALALLIALVPGRLG